MNKALLIVDVQNDFCKDGALEVPDGDEVVKPINQLIEKFDNVIQTQDWHPSEHLSFASSHENKNPFDTIELPYGEQVLWPDHCVQGSKGAEFHPELNTQKTHVIIRKGFRKEIDSYSTFFENDKKTKTGLTGYLKSRGIDTLYVAGLATDFCVKWSVLDGISEGFRVHIIKNAVRGINMNGSLENAWKEMKKEGVDICTTEDLTI